jgi:hypothetical protein
LTPLADSTRGLTPLTDDVSGLTPLDESGGLTPLDDAGGLTPLDDAGGLTPLDDTGGLTPLESTGGLTPLDDAGGLTPLSDTGGLTPLGSDPLGSPFATGPTPSVNPYQAPAYRASSRRAAPSRGVVMAPAIAIMLVVGLSGLVMIPYLIFNTISMIRMRQAIGGAPEEVIPYGIGAVIGVLIFVGIYGVMFFGAWRMMQFENWGIALTSAILMLFPCTVCWIGLPIGIWAIVVLSMQSTRDQFA